MYKTGGFTLLELGETCQEKAFSPIDTLDECIYSESFIQKYYPTYFFVKQENKTGYPKGCYVFIDNDEYKGFFNTDSAGSGQPNSRAVCKEAIGRLLLNMLPHQVGGNKCTFFSITTLKSHMLFQRNIHIFRAMIVESI